MARERVLLDFQTMKHVAQKHANDMNELIQKANADQIEAAKGRLGDFIDEALGVLEVDVLIQRYQSLQVQMSQIEHAYQLAVGRPTVKNRTASIQDVLNRDSIIDRVERLDPILPAELVVEVNAAAARHGLTLLGTDAIATVDYEEVLASIRGCRTEDEMMQIIKRNSVNVLMKCGVTRQDLLKLVEDQKRQQILQDKPLPEVDNVAGHYDADGFWVADTALDPEPTDPFHTLR